MKRLSILLISLMCYHFSLGQTFTVIPVPYRQFNTSIPHPAFNGQLTTFKAIARSSDPAAQFYYRWDPDGDGDWDNMGETPVIANGNWYRNNCYMLDGRYSLPVVDPGVTTRKLFIAVVEVAESVDINGNPTNSKFGSYPVMVYADVPSKDNANTATDDQLGMMREVALDDAMWYLHKQLSRTGTGSQVMGYLGQSNSQYNIASTALYLQTLIKNGHSVGYKSGSYTDYGVTLPTYQTVEFDRRWNSDPYAEDALRAMNYLLNNITVSSITSGVGFTYPYSELNEDAWAIVALATSGMAGTVSQVGNATYVIGKRIEQIIQKFVDFIAYSQIKTGSDNGGWYYLPGGSQAVSYLTGGRVSALMAAEMAMGYAGVTVTQDVKDRLVNILLTFQRTDGGIPYMRGYSNSTLEPTGLFMAGTGWLGWNQFSTTDNTSLGNPYISATRSQARVCYDKYQKFIADNWNKVSNGPSPADLFGHWSDGNYNSGSTTHSFSYTLFNTKLGATGVIPELYTFTSSVGASINWKRQFSVATVRGQNTDGSFQSAQNYWFISFLNQTGQTAMECITLTPSLFDPDPVAIGDASPKTVVAGCTGGENGKVTFSHSLSYHLSPVRTIADYQWLFNVTDPNNPNFNAINWAAIPNNGSSADGKAFHTNSRDYTPLYRYLMPGTYNAALRVVDDNNPSKSNIIVIKNISVLAPASQPPQAEAGGPYRINAGQMLTLAGSYIDPDIACNPSSICTANWDLDGDGNFDDFSSAAGSLPWAGVSALNLQLNTSLNVSLKVTNSTGLITTKTTTLTICNLTVNLGEDKTICLKDTVQLEAGNGFASYLWSNGMSTSGIKVWAAGTYNVTVSNITGCSASDAVLVSVNPLPDLELGADKVITTSDQITLDAGNGNSLYLWNDGSVNRQLVVDGSIRGTGTHTFWVLKENELTHCKNSDTIRITINIPTHTVKDNNRVPEKLYPNPASSEIRIELSDENSGLYMIELINILGKPVKKFDLMSADRTLTIDIQDISPGIYILRLSKNEKTRYFRFIKE